jgi:hypothetical protein
LWPSISNSVRAAPWIKDFSMEVAVAWKQSPLLYLQGLALAFDRLLRHRADPICAV